MTIRNPVEWGAAQLKMATRAVESASHAVYHADESPNVLMPKVRRIAVSDLREVLVKGVEDFAAYRTDVIFISLIYPVVGLVLGRVAVGYDMLPLLFPLASGFALVGPFVAIGLYEMSRRREEGAVISWVDAFGVLRSPAFAAILVLGFILMAIFLAWLIAAQLIYNATLGPEPPESVEAFVRDVFMTAAGRTMIVVGVGVGFLFACLSFAVSVVSFPLLLDRHVGVGTAVWTSIRTVLKNPIPMACWGMIVVAGLVIGSLPLLVGLIIVMPVLGHATWHLYRKVVAR
ncbi:DUF2189 domain-containing protein [Chelatococcus sp. SYSU_G07232]|uniref:DUF2189 domain-containing protein n=1 Tax=Chelatococcus albus TaxID=3047466 RepID=A0ABT7AM23_9HYPH|nr:DUF2189 domain-containing protein [Chelatococcus sp. SYSU_G07232]MDJ1159626.1 DUF2189 domain-containing protein [Chelatococcus sp. SYSU_G07232]